MGPKPGPVSSMLLSQFPKSKMSTGIPIGLGKRKVLKKRTGIEEWSNLKKILYVVPDARKIHKSG